MAGKPAGTGFPSLEHIAANPIRGPKGVTLQIDLALDLSSSCVGWAAGSTRVTKGGADRKLERYGKLVFKTTAGVGEKLVSFEDYLRGLLHTYRPRALLIEKPMLRRGSTTSRHTELLGICRKVWFQETETEIADDWLISPVTIKRQMAVKRGADHDENKQIMVAKVNALYRLGLKWDPGSKYKSDDDVADAVAVLTTRWRQRAR